MRGKQEVMAEAFRERAPSPPAPQLLPGEQRHPPWCHSCRTGGVVGGGLGEACWGAHAPKQQAQPHRLPWTPWGVDGAQGVTRARSWFEGKCSKNLSDNPEPSKGGGGRQSHLEDAGPALPADDSLPCPRGTLEPGSARAIPVANTPAPAPITAGKFLSMSSLL